MSMTVPSFVDVMLLLHVDKNTENLTWWERKMIKAQEGMIDSMTADNWLELELIRGVYDRNLQKRTL